MRLSRRAVVLGLVALLAAGLVAAVAATYLWRTYESDGQAISITGEVPRLDDAPGSPPPDGAHPFVSGVSADGRSFVDQHDRPILVRGDSPWSLLSDLTAAEADEYWRDRARFGVNAAIISLIGARANGGNEDGSTVDGIHPFGGAIPFLRPGDVTEPEPAYFQRAHEIVSSAARHGITVFLYPVDGWAIGHAFTPDEVAQCATYGRYVGRTFADLPNIVWAVGGDFTENQPPSDVDRCYDAVRVGLRSVGDERPLSIQFVSPLTLSTDSPYWRTRVDWNFVYSYAPTYIGVLRAYARTPPVPAVLGESNYERMNLQAGTPDTTDASLRRQTAWALTSGGAGDFYGSADWEFLDGWESRLDSSGLAQVAEIRAAVEALRWWDLVPDDGESLVSAGRGTPTAPADAGATDVLQSSYATAARTPDGRQAVAYVPTERRLRLDLALLSGAPSAAWVDPTDGRRLAAPLRETMSTPGPNAAGDGDWLLVITQESGR